MGLAARHGRNSLACLALACLSLACLSLGRLGLSSTRSAAAHTVVTRDGEVHEGEVILEDADKVVIQTTFGGTRTIARTDVKTLDLKKPPLRDQLAFRLAEATSAAQLYGVYLWAQKQGFRDELPPILTRVVEADPAHKKAHQLLGHVLYEGRWTTPEEQRALEAEQEAEAQRAAGFVQHEGAWVTPEDRDAMLKGLRKDAGEWVEEAEWHRRRGERLVDGVWIRFGESEGAAYTALVKKGSRLPFNALWSPHFDVLHEVPEDIASRVASSAEKALGVARSILRPTPADWEEDDPNQRVRLVLMGQMPAFSRFSRWFGEQVDAESLVPGWALSTQMNHSWWWVQDVNCIAAYQMPNTDNTFISNVVHLLGPTLLTIYKRDYRFPSAWLREGFGYHLEMESLGYSLTFSLGRGGASMGAGEGADPEAWMDTAKWRAGLAQLVAAGNDPPLHRMARMSLGEFRYEELAKAWSVVECLVRWDRAKFKHFIDLAKERDAEEEASLRTAFGVGLRDLDEKWRDYVRKGFKHGA